MGLSVQNREANHLTNTITKLLNQEAMIKQEAQEMIKEVMPLVDNDWAKAKAVCIWALEEFGPKMSRHLFKMHSATYLALPEYSKELKKQIQEL